jgi:hypothetical protein
MRRLGAKDMSEDELRLYIFRYAKDLPRVAAEVLRVEPLLRPSGIWRSTEPADMQAFFDEFSSCCCRIFWQLGFVYKALPLAQEELAKQPGNARWKAIEAFLGQQQQTGQPAAAGQDPQQMSLFQSFPGWLDQLVSQVVGRPVSLAIEVEQAPDSGPATMFSSIKPHAEVYLVEADGSKVPFSWQVHPSGNPIHSSATTSPTTTSGSSSNEAVRANPVAGFMPAEDIYEKYLLPGVASSAQHLQALDPPGSDPATTRSGGTGHEQSRSFQSAAAGGSSTTTTSSSGAPRASSTLPGGNRTNVFTFGSSFGNVRLGELTLENMESFLQLYPQQGR